MTDWDALAGHGGGRDSNQGTTDTGVLDHLDPTLSYVRLYRWS